MASTADINGAIERIYRSVGDADGWSDALKATAELLGGSGALLMIADPLTGTIRSIVADGFEDAFARRYRDEIGPHDPWLRALLTRTPDDAFSTEALAAERVAVDDENHAQVDAFLRAHDGGHVLGAVLSTSKEDKTVIAVHRSQRAGPHDSENIEMFETLLPHLRNAFDMWRKVGAVSARSACLEELMELLPIGIFLVDAEMRVVMSNRFGRRMTTARDGMVVRDGRLRATDSTEHSRLEKIVKSVAKTPPGTIPAADSAFEISPPARAHTLQILGLPVNSGTQGQFGGSYAEVAILVGDPDTVIAVSQAVIGALFGLTNAESRLVKALVTGLRVRELADSLGLSEQTIRTQLKRVLQKTGAGRQSELMRFLLTGPSLFTCDPEDDTETQ